MCCGKCFRFLINIILPYSILLIFLFQIYSQYSTIVTFRTKKDNIKDGRRTMTNYQLTKDKHYDFNMNKVKEYFEENAIMNIPYAKNFTLELIEKRNVNKDKDFDNRIYMFFYLIFYDIISLIIVYLFIYGSIRAGLLKIIFQIIRFYFNAKRIKRFNNHMSIYSIINSKLENIYLFRGWSIFNPEGFLIIEFLCNFAIILDIILLLIYIYRVYKYNKYRRYKELNAVIDDNSTEEENEENDEKDNKSDNNNKIIESRGDESDEESNQKNNNIIEKNKKGDGNINLDFENEDEDIEVSEESDNRQNNIQKNKIIEDTQDE